jgi:alcohol dehydrogenase, propanol-preferring
MGFEVVAIGCGADKDSLGESSARHYIDSPVDPGQALQELGGAGLVITAASGGKAVAQIVKGLRPRGKIMTLGATPDPYRSLDVRPALWQPFSRRRADRKPRDRRRYVEV